MLSKKSFWAFVNDTFVTSPGLETLPISPFAKLKGTEPIAKALFKTPPVWYPGLSPSNPATPPSAKFSGSKSGSSGLKLGSSLNGLLFL